MILFEFIITGLAYIVKAIFALVLIGLLLMILIIAREVAWYIREQNKKKMEDKENENDSI